MHTSERAATLWGLAGKRAVTHQKLSSTALVNFTRNPGNIPSPTRRKPTVGAPTPPFLVFLPSICCFIIFSNFFYNFSFFGAWVCLALLRLQQQSCGARALWECDVRPLSQTFLLGLVNCFFSVVVDRTLNIIINKKRHTWCLAYSNRKINSRKQLYIFKSCFGDNVNRRWSQ